MKKLLVIALLMASTAAYAADASPAASPAATAPHGKHYTFDEKKAWHLKQISEHIAALQKAQSCYEAAKDDAALKACNAERPHAGWHRGWHHGKAQGASDGTSPAPANSQ